MARTPQRILFVCLGNICRSPLAEGLFRQHVQQAGLDDQFQVDSAGTGDWHIGEHADPRTRANAQSHGLELVHRARQLQPADFETFDYVVCMDSANVRNALLLVPSEAYRAKVMRMRDVDPEGAGDVPDPYHGEPAGFELVYQMLDRCTAALLTRFLTDTVPLEA